MLTVELYDGVQNWVANGSLVDAADSEQWELICFLNGDFCSNMRMLLPEIQATE